MSGGVAIRSIDWLERRIMFFTWSSAVKEVQRQINAGNHYVRMEKRWYGWVIVHPSNREITCREG